METETNIASDIMAADLNTRYDNACKKLLSYKMFLAWIMKTCVSEFHETDVNEIAEKYIEGTPEVGTTPVMPNQTNASISGMPNDDASINEGAVRYDIRFYAIAPQDGGRIKLIVNVEVQNRYHNSYSIIRRAIYYLARLISAQYGIEFEKSHYEDVKKVYSIWIQPSPPKEKQNTITQYSMREIQIIGNNQEKIEDYDMMTAVLVNLGNPEDIEEPSLLRLLNILMSDEMRGKEKTELIKNEFEIPMTRELESEVDEVCNLSQGIMMKGIQKGMQKGMQQGIQQGMQQGIQQGIQQGVEKNRIEALLSIMQNLKVPFQQAAELLNVPKNEYEKYEKLVEKVK